MTMTKGDPRGSKLKLKFGTWWKCCYCEVIFSVWAPWGVEERRKYEEQSIIFLNQAQTMSDSDRKGLVSRAKVAGFWEPVNKKWYMGAQVTKFHQELGRGSFSRFCSDWSRATTVSWSQGIVQLFNSRFPVLGAWNVRPLAGREGSHEEHWPQWGRHGPPASPEIGI